jgi:RNA polymerase sigma factor (sigma-70 family)
MKIHDDAALVVSLQEGNQRVWALIFNKYHDVIFWNIYGRIKDFDVTEELTMDTFEALFRTKHRLKKDQSILPYLITISKNKCIDFNKKQSTWHKKKSSYERDIAARQNYVFNDSLEKDEEKKNKLSLLRRAISHIKGKQKKKITTMSLIDEKEAPEIAAELHIQERVVRNVLSMSRKQVKQQIDSFRKK